MLPATPASLPNARRRPHRRAWLVLPALVIATGCTPTRFEALPVIPEPLVTRIPLVVGVHVPQAFREAVHHEKRDGAEVTIMVGKAQTHGFERLMNAMFTRVVPLASPAAAAATDAEIRGVIEPVLEEFSFVTPRDTGTPLYAVSLRYRINVYTPDGRLDDSWSFTGYGAQSSSSTPGQGKEALREATGLAMRDAGARIAVEFREQAIVRGLIDGGQEPVPGPPPSGDQPPP